MSSRITSNMLSSNYLRNMKLNLGNMKTLQNQLASGKEIQIASDDPYKALRSMQLNTEISYNTQYNENITDTSNWLDTTDTALSQIGTVLGRVQTLLVNAGNGTYSDSERSSIQDEVKSSANELSQILNTNFDGSYIFGGTKSGSKPTTVDANGKLQYADKDGNAITKTSTGMNIDLSTNPIESSVIPSNNKKIEGIVKSGSNVTITIKDYTVPATPVTSTSTIDLTTVGTGTPPATVESLFKSTLTPNFTADDVNEAISSYSSLDQINSDLKVDISEGVTTDYNRTATDILEFKDKNGNAINVSDLLSNIIDNLGSSDQTKINQLTSQNLTDIQSVTANLLQNRSEVGTMQNRMDSAKANNETANENMTDILSKTEDIDITEKTMEYSIMQTTYTAALQVSAKILPMSILTYL